MHKRLLSLLIVMFAVLMPTKLWAQEPYAVLTGDTISGMTLTFYYDGNKLAYKDAMSVGPFSADNDRGWHEVQYLIKNVVFDQSFANCDMLTSTTYWFKDFNNLTSIMGLENLKTDNVTDMVQMFKGCSSLTSLDLSTFNTEKVIDMTWMFYECSGLTSLNVSNFNTANVTRTYGMFLGCSGLTSLDVTGFNTQKVTDMSGMFENCFGLTSLDVTGFNTENVTSMGGIFSGCSGLTSLDLSSFDIQSVKYTSHMFSSCSGLKSLDLSGFNTEKVTDMSGMFENCSGLKSLDLSGFNTENVTSMSHMFRGCSGLTSLSLGGINTVNVINMYRMFSGCSALTSLDVTGFNTQNVTHMSDMFRDCSSLTSLDVTGFNTEKVTDMSGMFENCSMLTSLDVTGFNTQNVTSMNDMFSTCSSLTSLDLSVFQTDNVMDMRWMFRGCSSLTTIYAGNEWTTAEVTYGSYLFTGCTNLVGGKGTIYDANHTDYTYARIDGGPNSETPGYFTDKNASEEIAAPTFRFEGDSLFIETATKDASIFYQMADLPNMDEATVQKISESLTVTADAQQSIYYEQPIELKKSVVLKAIAAGAAISEVSTLVYDYDAWQKLLEALDYGMDVSGRASDNSNVPDDMKEQLTHMLEEGKWVYYERMWDHNAVDNLTNEIMQLAHQIDEMMTVVTEPEPYAVLSDNNTVLTFYYDENKKQRNGMSVGPFAAETDRGWDEYKGNINTAIFDDSFAKCSTITSTAYWFASCYNSLTIQGLNNLKTDNVTDMTMMFHSTWLKDIDVSGFNTSKVTSMRNMFSACSMSSLDVSNFNTENVTDFNGMFSSNSHLTSLDLKNFNTANATSLRAMFSGCTQLANIDLSSFNTANVTDMNNMFSSCTNLQHLDLSHFNTDKVRDIRRMFLDCRNLTSLDISSLKTDSVLSMEMLFENCAKLESLDLSSFNTKDIWEMRYMFDGCTNLKTIYVGSEWNTGKVSSGENMFRNCTNLIGGKGTTYDANHVDYTYAHIDGGPSNPGYFTDKNAQADDGLELYAIDVESEMKSNETFMPTQSVKMTLGNDSEWSTNNDLAPELGGELKFDANIYYPGIYNKNYAFVSSVVGTNNPAAGPLVDGMSTGSSYKPRWRNLPESGAYFIFESEQDGSLIVPIRINPNKPLYVTDDAGVPLIAYQLKDQDGVTVALDSNSSTAEKTIAFLSLNVSKNQKYYIFCKGSKPRVGGYIFAPYTIDIDPATTAAALDSLLAEPVDATFDSNGVLSAGGGTTMADALEYVGGRAEVAKTITAIVWNSTATLTNDDLKGLDNPNMLIYVKDAALAPANRDNVVIGGLAKNIVLADVESGNNNFYCPQAFTAEMISYTRNFQQQTEIGVSRGWETIALPFTVQTIMHEKNGVITPFGNDASEKHFWLRQLTQEGLAQARKIEANTPYLISMPNNNEYPAEFIQAGRVTFSSQSAIVPVTSGNVASMRDSVSNTMIVFYPAMQRVAQNEEIYALNVSSAQAGYAEGSVFVAGLRDVRPFECYTWHHAHGSAPRYIPINELNGGVTGIEDVRGLMSNGRGENWYDLNGRRLQQKPKQKGVYLHNGHQVVIK